MADNLNEYFSLVFTGEEGISTLPVPETKFEGRECRLFRTTNCNPKNGSYENKGYDV